MAGRERNMGYWAAAVWVAAAAGGAAAAGHWFGKGEKIDRGLVFFYWKLSYRRRFIRTLWLLPSLPLVIVLVQAVFQDWLFTAVISVELLGLWAAQAVVNYRKWKKTEGELQK